VCAGEVDKDENIKTIAVQPKKSARADVKKKVKAVGQKAAKVTPLKARSIRIKRSVQGEGKPLMLLSCIGIQQGFILPSCRPEVWSSLHVPGCVAVLLLT